jgi:hypothetical protein
MIGRVERCLFDKNIDSEAVKNDAQERKNEFRLPTVQLNGFMDVSTTGSKR